ncbi:MAG: DUF58 domain-containing protein [Candidatus Gracilibacteria bacterium]|nr:DUF58 domain-containing protein [Candidatus Gracilibacteria bacterium]
MQSRYSGNFISQIRANSGDFHELRPYVFGEESTRIDYKKSNFEENSLIVREYVQEKTYEVCLVFVIDPSLRFGTTELTKFDIISEAIMMICDAVWEKELQGSCYIASTSITPNQFLEYPFPRDAQELQHFLIFLKKTILSCTTSLSGKQTTSILKRISENREQKGILLFGENFLEKQIHQFFSEFQLLQILIVHPVEHRIAKNNTLPEKLLTEPISKAYGAQVVLSQPEQIGNMLQSAFHVW